MPYSNLLPDRFSRPRRKGSALKNPVGALHTEAVRNMLPVMSIEEIEAAISQLSPDDLARLAAWFMEFQVGAGDQQLDADVKGGEARPIGSSGQRGFSA